MVSLFGLNNRGKDDLVSLDVPPSLPDTVVDRNMVSLGDEAKSGSYNVGNTKSSGRDSKENFNSLQEKDPVHFEDLGYKESRKLPNDLVSPELKNIKFSFQDKNYEDREKDGFFKDSFEDAISQKSQKSKLEMEELYQREKELKSKQYMESKANPFDFYNNYGKNVYQRDNANPSYFNNTGFNNTSNQNSIQKISLPSNEMKNASSPLGEGPFDNCEKFENSENPSISFFKELQRRFQDEKNELYSSISTGLLHKMKDYHESIKSGKHFFLGDKDVDDVVYRYLLELRELESEWLIRSKEFESARNLLLEKENEIEKKLARFNNVIRNAEKFRMLSKKTTSDKAFRLENGVMLFSVEDLLYELSRINEDIFRHHVNEERNDFSTWIEHVFLYTELSRHVRDAKSKDEMIRIIKDF